MSHEAERGERERRVEKLRMAILSQKIVVEPYSAEPVIDGCGCWHCTPEALRTFMFLCSTCGNKRCPRATFHGNRCDQSNDYGQTGSRYGRLGAPRLRTARSHRVPLMSLSLTAQQRA